MRSYLVLICLVCSALLVGCKPGRHAKSPVFGTCINGLRMIDGAKQQWALEHNVKSNATPTMEEIRPYMGCAGSYGMTQDMNWLKCPAGGSYTIGDLDEPPTCSLGGEGHVLQ